jgi:hypothetical protein
MAILAVHPVPRFPRSRPLEKAHVIDNEVVRVRETGFGESPHFVTYSACNSDVMPM